MSRTYRLRHLPQPEGGRSARRFVDSRLRNPKDRAEEAFIFRLAHVLLKLPCKIKLPENYPVEGWGKAPLYRGWQNSHDRCLPAEMRDYLWTLRFGTPYWNLGWTRTLNIFSHPLIGYGLAIVPSSEKKYGRKQVYREARRRTKRLLRVVRFIDYREGGCCDGLCDPPQSLWRAGPEIDPESDRMDFEAKSVKRGLAESAWRLTW